MKKIRIFQIDAFADRLFAGNPAAVCLLDHWIDEQTMQQIAAENNLSETAFIVPAADSYEIRWFTPVVEVDLCGHATLAGAFVLLNFYNQKAEEINFFSPRSGVLNVSKDRDLLWLDFPADSIAPSPDFYLVQKAIGLKPLELFRGKTDYMAVLRSEEEIRRLKPDFSAVTELPARGLIVTAPGIEADFVSRFFAPQSGIEEDPATGSAHTTLIPYWSERLGKKVMQAAQLSKRGGTFFCRNDGSRMAIGGRARLYLTGEIYLDQ